MQVLLYECFSGIAGDMNLGALIDVGVPESHLRQELSLLNLDDEYELVVSKASKQGIFGTNVNVSCRPTHRHRNLPHIQSLIKNSDLPDAVEATSLTVFQNLAEAEAKIHGITPEEVHFHEVGATDAIVDVVGAAICLNYLKPDSVACGPVELGSGTVKCEHGVMPVPAPATAELLKNRPTTRGRVRGEATTPTGAAILSGIVDSFEMPIDFCVARIGYGIGQKDFEVPNVLRVSIGEAQSSLERETNIEIECNIDDMSAEALGAAVDRLFRVGALDVFVTPIVMKKSRPAHRLSVLCRQLDESSIVEAVLQETTTLGVRTHRVNKHMIPRRVEQVTTRFGIVNVKLGTLPDGSTRWKVEHDDIQAIATDKELPYLQVRSQVNDDVAKEIADHE